MKDMIYIYINDIHLYQLIAHYAMTTVLLILHEIMKSVKRVEARIHVALP